MKVRNTDISIRQERDNYYVNFGFTFQIEEGEINEQDMRNFMAQIIIKTVNQNFEVDYSGDLLVPTKNSSAFIPTSTSEQNSDELVSSMLPLSKTEQTVYDELANSKIPLSLSEQKVYGYIKKEAPEGKKAEIVWRWPTGKAVIPEDLEKFINCTQHNEPRVARYSYEKRMNPTDQTKHNFWISHSTKIEGEWCAQDLEVDKLVYLYDIVDTL